MGQESLMSARVLLDTDVLIDYLRGLPRAVAFVEGLDLPPLVSAVTVAELYAGVRDDQERPLLEAMLETTLIVAVDAEVAKRAGLYKRDYFKSHGVGIADAMVAASASHAEALLATPNKKHFPMLSKVAVPYRK
jgi:predicted nucleic acid-binding protein